MNTFSAERSLTSYVIISGLFYSLIVNIYKRDQILGAQKYFQRSIVYTLGGHVQGPRAYGQRPKGL